MQGFDILQIVLLAAVLMGLAVLFFSRSRRDGGVPSSEIPVLKKTIGEKDAELLDVRRSADRFEALAEERKATIDGLNGDLSNLRAKLEHEGEEKRKLSNRISELETEMEAERKASKQKMETLINVRKEMEERFGQLAREALKTQGEAFSKSNLEKLEATLTPLKEHVGLFQNELKTVHQETVKDRERLKAEITQLSKRSEEISQEAVALTRALKSDRQKQGAWGEMVLESILQRSGLREGEEYETQAHRTGAEGERLRPDVVVNLPENKTLVIDSKVSLNDYMDAVNAETDEEAAAARKRHVASLRRHIGELAGRDYQKAEDFTVDYVIMFVPIEGVLSEALREDGSITGYAIEKNVMIATPTTLMMALKTVANVWAVERRSRNAERIAERAGKVYDKVAGFAGNMENVGKRLDQAKDAYQSAFGQLSRGRGNLLSQAERLKSLGAKTTRSIGVEFDDHESESESHESEPEAIGVDLSDSDEGPQ